jgi:hypothetical protein
VRESAHRIDYFEEAWRLFDALVALHLRHGRFETAFAAAERGRAHEMRTGLVRGSATLAPLLDRIPADTVLLYYVVLPHELVTWVLRRGEWRCERVPSSRNSCKR